LKIALFVCLATFGVVGCGDSRKTPETVPVFPEKPPNVPGGAPKQNSGLKIGCADSLRPAMNYAAEISPTDVSIARTVFSMSDSECAALVIPAKPQKSTPCSNIA